MALTTYSPQQIFTNTVAAVQQYTSRIKNFGSGTIAGALVHAVRANVLYIQGLAVQLYAFARASTSHGADLTSFVADYNLNPTRVAATYANGPVYFGKYNPGNVQTIVLNGTVTQNTTLPPVPATQFIVVPDPTNSTGNYDATVGGGIGGYKFPAGVTSMEALVQATVAGPGGNAIAGTLTQIATPNVGADFVTQPNDLTNGEPQESDPALRVRFANYLSSLAKANNNSIAAAISSSINNLTFTQNEYLDANQVPKAAWFTIVVDDGTGNISAPNLAIVKAAIDADRAAGIGRDVIAPQNLEITVAISGTQVLPNFSAAAVRLAIQSAIILAINANGVGGYNPATGVATGRLPYATIANVIAAFVGPAVGQGLANFGYTLAVNGGVADISVSPYQLARSSAPYVTVN